MKKIKERNVIESMFVRGAWIPQRGVLGSLSEELTFKVYPGYAKNPALPSWRKAIAKAVDSLGFDGKKECV